MRIAIPGDRPRVLYLIVGGALVVLFGALVIALFVARDWDDTGPLSFREPAMTKPLDPAYSVEKVTRMCGASGDIDTDYPIKVVGAHLDDRDYYACYQLDGRNVFAAVVIDNDGFPAPDSVVKDGGAWPWIGLVKSWLDIGFAIAGGVTLVVLYFLYYRRPARSRRSRYAFWAAFFIVWSAVFGLLVLGGFGDPVGAAALTGLLATGLFGALGGRWLVRPPAAEPSAVAPSGPTAATAPAVAASAPPPAVSVSVREPGSLPTFRDIGGMADLKQQLRDTFGLLLAFSGEADQYRINFNGLLLHGPPGVGKTFFAQASAGEFGLNFLHVSASDLISSYVGQSATNVRSVFAHAARHVPCLLFFDEFDSVAQRRDEGSGEESKRVVTQLLQSLEEYRRTRDLIVMAATNHLDTLDPAIVRAGRFDRRIRIDLPDQAARVAIVEAHLRGRPLDGDIDVAEVAGRLKGRTPAVIARAVDDAAMAAFKEATSGGAAVTITSASLRSAIDGLGGRDRPTVEDWTWDRLVLDERTKDELRQVQALVKDPDLARSYGAEPPSGLLLEGPPGTGKTTIARVFAAEAGCSFYPITATDLVSMFVGESEANVRRLFDRARENAPAVIFIDEIDSLAGDRATSSSWDQSLLTQLLAEIDGMTEARGVFVMAATNRAEALDAALLRGGRLSRRIRIGLPDPAQRRQFLAMFTAAMPLVDVDLDALAAKTDSFAGADIEALCRQAAVEAMLVAQDDPSLAGSVTPRAFARALAAKGIEFDESPPEPGVGGYL